MTELVLVVLRTVSCLGLGFSYVSPSSPYSWTGKPAQQPRENAETCVFNP
jgi:hypothetical protein